MAFFPLTNPLTTGPGSIAAAVALGADRPSDLAGLIGHSSMWVLMSTAVALTIYIADRRASTFSRLLGPDGTLVVTRLSAFLLLCVGVQIMVTGVTDAARPILR